MAYLATSPVLVNETTATASPDALVSSSVCESMPMREQLTRLLRWCAGSVAVALALAGCGGGDAVTAPVAAQAAPDQVIALTQAQQSVNARISTLPHVPLAAVSPQTGREDFESGMSDWSNWGNAQVVAGVGTSGSQAMQVGTGAGGAGLNVPGIVPGTAYRLTAQVRVSDPSETVFIGVNMLSSSGDQVIGQSSGPVTATGYATVTVDLVAPANAASAVVWVWKNAGSGFGYLDDVAFGPATNPPPPPAPPGSNLVSNGGFENGMTDWVNWGNASVVSGQASSGTSALSVGTAAGGAGHDVDGIVPGTVYRLVAQAKVSDASGTVFVGVNLLNQAGTTVAQQASSVSSTSYSTVSLDITAPSDAIKAVVYVWKNAGSGFGYVDDYVFGVAPGSAPPPPSGNLLVNSGFESGLANWDNWGNASTSTAQAAAGSFAAQVGSGAGGFGQNVGGIIAGKTYRVSALAKVSSADEIGYLGVRFTDDAGTRLLEQNVSFSSTAYSTAQLDIVAPANATRALVYVWKNAGSGFAYVDEVSLIQAAGSNSVSLTPVVSGLTSPIDLQATDDGTGRLFVVEQPGTIRILQAGALLPTPFLDIRSRVTFRGEMGLLGAAFHPAFAQNQRFYVNYVRVLGTGEIQSVIAEYRVSAADPNQADPASERILLTVNHPFETHKAGQLAFGPDGFLYIALGDGGGAGDTQGSGQNLQTLLGKMLRIDVDRTAGAQPYAIPADNPFVAGGGLPEIWAYGLRNPFRFSFDTATGRLFLGDVGQRLYEEIDILQKGGNYGWNVMEGMHCFNPATGCNQAGLTLPIAEYDHSEGVAVIGGYVYRGAGIPALAGSYVFGDFGSGNIWRLTQDNAGAWQRVLLLSSGRNMSSFGRDSAGELYLVDYAEGAILKLSP